MKIIYINYYIHKIVTLLYFFLTYVNIIKKRKEEIVFVSLLCI